jgi:hypothetical protein
MIRMKRGVVLVSKEPYIFEMILAARNAYGKLGKDVIITSGIDGAHSSNSLHYKGRALDFRTRHLSDGERVEVMASLRSHLGDDFDVVFEGDHFHCEYDPH